MFSFIFFLYNENLCPILEDNFIIDIFKHLLCLYLSINLFKQTLIYYNTINMSFISWQEKKGKK